MPVVNTTFFLGYVFAYCMISLVKSEIFVLVERGNRVGGVRDANRIINGFTETQEKQFVSVS